MSAAFHTAFMNATAAVKAARRLGDLEIRWNNRFRIWEHHDDPGVAARIRRLVMRQRAARAAAEEAERRLDALWHRLSPSAIGEHALGRLHVPPPAVARTFFGRGAYPPRYLRQMKAVE